MGFLVPIKVDGVLYPAARGQLIRLGLTQQQRDKARKQLRQGVVLRIARGGRVHVVEPVDAVSAG
jgi:hypothetical protein